MVSKYKHHNIIWYDMENPEADEVRELVEKYSIDPIVGNELLGPSDRPHIDYHDNYIYLILHFPVTSNNPSSMGGSDIEEVDFIIGKNFIITTRYGVVDALLRFSKAFEVSSLLSKNNTNHHTGHMFFHMIKYLYKSLSDQIDYAKDGIQEIEEKVFSGQEAKMVVEISRLNRRLLNFRDAISMHYEILRSFENAGTKFFDSSFQNNLKVITSEYVKVQSSLDSTREYLLELRDTNDSLLTTKQNELMKTFTIIAFTTFPLTLIASIFGMNTLTQPIIGIKNDFWIILGLMFLTTGIMFLYFRFKKWL